MCHSEANNSVFKLNLKKKERIQLTPKLKTVLRVELQGVDVDLPSSISTHSRMAISAPVLRPAEERKASP